MTVHFGTAWLIGLLSVVYLVGVIVGNLLVQVAYMDSYPPWYVRFVPLLWPIIVPLFIGYVIVRVLLMPFFGE